MAAGSRRAPNHHLPLMLLGASLVLFSAVGTGIGTGTGTGKPLSAVHAGCALAGLMLWLLGAAHLLLFATTKLPAGPGGARAPTTAAVEEKPKKHCSVLGHQHPEPAS